MLSIFIIIVKLYILFKVEQGKRCKQECLAIIERNVINKFKSERDKGRPITDLDLRLWAKRVSHKLEFMFKASPSWVSFCSFVFLLLFPFVLCMYLITLMWCWFLSISIEVIIIRNCRRKSLEFC